MSSSGGDRISAADCCFTGVAICVLSVQSSWALAKQSAKEGWLTCKVGAHEAYRFARHTGEAAVHLIELAGEVALRMLKEVGSLFLTLRDEIKKGAFTTGGALQSVVECAVWMASPLSEIGTVCQRGAHTTVRALRGSGKGCASGAGTLYALIAPFVHEGYQTVVSGFEMSEKADRALLGTSRSGFEFAQEVLGGSVQELIDLFVTALEMIGKTGLASKEAVKSWLSMSRESSYCLLMEAASALKIGYEECLKAVDSLPPAVRAFCFLPASGGAALLKECAQTVQIGANTTLKTGRGIYQAAVAGIDLLRETLLATLHECLHSGATGLQQSQRACVAVMHAINHGTEGMRSALFAILSEGGTTLSVGGSSSLRAARALFKALLHVGEIVPARALLDETTTTLRSGSKSSIKALTAAAGATVRGTEPLRELAYRTGQEGLYALKTGGHQTTQIGSAVHHSIAKNAFQLSEWPVRSAGEVVAVAYAGLRSFQRFHYQMSDGVADNMRVFVYYPLEELISPKLRAVSAALSRAQLRINRIMARFA